MEMADPVKQRRKVAKAPSSLSLNGSWSVLVAKADAFEVKRLTGGRLYVKGYATTWETDLENDRFSRGAFIQAARSRFLVLWEHQTWFRLGETSKAAEDSEGLYAEATLVPTPGVEPPFEAIRSGQAKAMSVCFKALSTHREGPVRVISKAWLVEASVCWAGVNSKVRILDIVDPQAVIRRAKRHLQEYQAQKKRLAQEAARLFAEGALIASRAYGP